MSLSKVQSIEENIRRDSFSLRVCDDLSEFVLQFLPIEDKFRFECVSKQFQRTVYQRHNQLFIKGIICRNIKTILEPILKKLPNIQSLKSYVRLKNSDIDLIIKYCDHLNQLDTTLIGISKTLRNKFIDKFGSQLKSISFCDSSYDLMDNSLTNIQEIEFKINIIPEDFLDFYSKIKPKNLRKVSFIVYWLQRKISEEDINYFNRVIEYQKNITHLSITYYSSNENQKDITFGVVSQLNQLISLELEGNIDFKSLTNDLRQLSDNCLKLKSLSLRFVKISEHFKDNDFMTEIKKIKELKRFEFEFKISSVNYSEFKEYFINSLKTGFQDLTHLTISFNDSEMNESFLENIAINLPKIQKLIIKNKINITEKASNILSRLLNLQILELNITDQSSSDSIRNQIIEKCRKIKSIQLYFEKQPGNVLPSFTI